MSKYSTNTAPGKPSLSHQEASSKYAWHFPKTRWKALVDKLECAQGWTLFKNKHHLQTPSFKLASRFPPAFHRAGTSRFQGSGGQRHPGGKPRSCTRREQSGVPLPSSQLPGAWAVPRQAVPPGQCRDGGLQPAGRCLQGGPRGPGGFREVLFPPSALQRCFASPRAPSCRRQHRSHLRPTCTPRRRDSSTRNAGGRNKPQAVSDARINKGLGI